MYKTNSALISLIHRFARGSGLLVAAVAVIVLLGWCFDVDSVKSILPDYPPMRVNTAIGLLLTGCMLYLVNFPRVGVALAVVVVLLNGIILLEYVSGINLGVDQLLFADSQAAKFGYYPGRSSVNAVMSFLLLSLSFYLYNRKPVPAYGKAQLVSLLVLLVIFASLLGYLYRVNGLVGIEKHSQMAPHTAVCFVVLAAGSFFLYPDQGFVRILTGSGWSALLVRRLFLAALMLPIALSSLVIWFFQLEQFSVELGFILFSVCYTFLFTTILFVYGREFLANETKQQEQQLKIEQLNKDLSAANAATRAVNEELLASNDALQSANERLYRANQSVKELSRQALQESAQQYKHLADSVEDVFYALDEKLRITFWNKVCEESTGISSNQAMGQHLFALKPRLRLFPSLEVLQEVLKSGTAAQTEIEEEIAGKQLHFNVRIYPAHRGLVVFAVDNTAVHTAERELKQQKERLELALNGAQLATWDLDVPSGKSLWSNRWYSMLGYTAGDLEESFETWKNLTHPDDLPVAMKSFEEHLSGKTDYVTFEHRLKKKTGDWLWTTGSGKLVERNHKGEPQRVIGVLQDISSLKNAEQELLEQKERLELALWAAELGIWDRDLQNGRLTVNERCAQMLGYTKAEYENILPLQGFRKTLHPDEAAQITEMLDKHLAGEIPYYRTERRARTKAGEWLWVLNSGKVVKRDKEGRPIRMIGIQQDISDFKKTEASLRFYKYLIDNIKNPIYWITPDDLKFKYVNKAACDHFGLPEDKLIGVGVLDFDINLDLEKAGSITSEISRNGTHTFKTVHKNSAGQLIPVELTLSSLYYNDTPYVVGYIRNISEQSAYEAKIRAINTELEQKVAARTAALEATNKELEAFSYSVSHDLRAPLRSIDGFSKAILEDYESALDEEGKDFLNRIRSSTQQMGQLIDDLLNLSRVSRAELKKQNVDISKLVLELVSELNQQQAGREVHVKVQPGLYAQADVRLIRIALENLLNNAWKYTGKTELARVEFGSMESGGRTVYFVKDNGAGFDMKYAARLFGAFQRLHRETEFEGTGVGLATVQRIIHKHGGQIWAEAEPAKGATFYFTLF
ncbi:PAS domain S-box protein [Cesiribacter sp. SM1]|uniref:PAS domain S-box protein n=1 Tax=Cesiribacter sp. SM1 TaxID=2861196 RepID=UPI001CD38387|nr:PAS domain S-box protein [Cesiribacter sp. SM1]